MGFLGSFGKFLWSTTPVGMVWNGLTGIWNAGSDMINDVKDATTSIIGGITNATSSSNLYDGGFAGMSETAIEDVKASIKKYVQEMQSSVNSFDPGKDIDTFLKGETNAAAREYVNCIKEIMSAYLNGLENVANQLDSYYAQFQESAKTIANDTKSSADQLRQAANSKNLD